MLGVFDVAPATNNYNLESQMGILHIILMFGGFGFTLTFIREVVKDIEDIEGDKAINAKSFPIILGELRTKQILVILTFLLIVALSYISYSVYPSHSPVSYYLLGLVIIPLIVFIIMLAKASTKKDFHKLSAMLKLIMLFGILSMLII